MVDQEVEPTLWDVTVYLVKDGPVSWTEVKPSQKDRIIKDLSTKKYYHQYNPTGETLILSRHVTWVKASVSRSRKVD